jgi:three-Cys-motif partner protein
VVYLDGYAGKGLYDDGSPGSPAHAIEVARIIAGFRNMIGVFVERDRDSYEALAAFVEEQGLDWPVIDGKIEDELDDILAKLDPRSPLFAFLDPFGLGLPVDVLAEKIMARGGSMVGAARQDGVPTEVLMNFSLSGLRRNAGHLKSTKDAGSYQTKTRPTFVAKVDAVLGGDWWQELWLDESLEKDEREAEVVNRFTKNLVQNTPGSWRGFRGPVADRWQGPPAYYLIFLTQHPDGTWSFINNLSKTVEEYRAYCFQQMGKMDVDLPGLAPAWERQIEENLEKLLAKGKSFQLSDKEIEVYAGVTGQAREMHVRRALKRLLAAGRTVTDPTGCKDLGRLVVRPPPRQ